MTEQVTQPPPCLLLRFIKHGRIYMDYMMRAMIAKIVFLMCYMLEDIE